MLDVTQIRLAQIREEYALLAAPGRTLGEDIARDARVTKKMRTLPLMSRIGRLGLSPDDLMVDRVAIYETLGHIDANLAAAAPGPVMTGFVIDALADTGQMKSYHQLFSSAPHWSCFALTEAHCGTDATAMTTTAMAVDGGWQLDGRKYMVGQGAIADLVVVFARTGPGPFGVDAFMFRPEEQPGFCARRLPVAGLEGTNLSELKFDCVLLPDEARLGRHLRAAERANRSVSASLDAMRPCLAAVALGMARAVLDRAEAAELTPRAWTVPYRHQLDAHLNWGLRIAEARDMGTILARDAGMMKHQSSALAERIVTAVLSRLSATGLADHPWLRRARRDVCAFEYMEGLSAIHRLNGANEFRSKERLSGV